MGCGGGNIGVVVTGRPGDGTVGTVPSGGVEEPVLSYQPSAGGKDMEGPPEGS